MYLFCKQYGSRTCIWRDVPRQQISMVPRSPNVDPVGSTLGQHGPSEPCCLVMLSHHFGAWSSFMAAGVQALSWGYEYVHDMSLIKTRQSRGQSVAMSPLAYNEGNYQFKSPNFVDDWPICNTHIPKTFCSENHCSDCIVNAKTFLYLAEGTMAVIVMAGCRYRMFKA